MKNHEGSVCFMNTPNCALLFKATITRIDFFKKLVVFLSYVFPFENRRRIIHLMASLTLDYNLATRWE